MNKVYLFLIALVLCIGAASFAPGAVQSAFAGPCNDHIDNDGDHVVDYSDLQHDNGCESATDPSEKVECNDGLNNDNDLHPDLLDSDCTATTDNTEHPVPPVLPQCSDGIDNDGDTWIDYRAEPNCISNSDDTELASPSAEYVTQCGDGKDNDGDGLRDPYNTGSECMSFDDWSEQNGMQWSPFIDMPAACQDGIDNDVPGDFVSDWPNDPGCESGTDTDETNWPPPSAPPTPGTPSSAPSNGFACGNNVDDDGDLEVDYVLGVNGTNIGDPGCYSRVDPDEGNVAECGDGVDNGIDGKIDMGGVGYPPVPADPDCVALWDVSENDTDYVTPPSEAGCVIIDPDDGICSYDGSMLEVQVTYVDDEMPTYSAYTETYNLEQGVSLTPAEMKCTIYGGRLRRIQSSLRNNAGIQCNFRAGKHRLQSELAYYDTFDDMVDEEDEMSRGPAFKRSTYGTSSMSIASIWPCSPTANDPNYYLVGTYAWSRVKINGRWWNVPWGNVKSKAARAGCSEDS